MVEKLILYSAVSFISLCIGGFIAASMASGYYKAKYDKEIERFKEMYRGMK